MILTHPLNTENAANKLAIEKYKDRLVIIEHGVFAMWWGKDEWTLKKNAEKITFKSALKLTKHYKEESKIRYHFVTDMLNDKPFSISDFDAESIYNCSTVTFDEPRFGY